MMTRRTCRYRSVSCTPSAAASSPRGSTGPLLDVASAMIGELFLVLRDLAVQLVRKIVDGRIHVAVRGLGVDRAAAEPDRRLRLVDQLLDGQYAVDVDHVIEMALELAESSRDVIAQRVRDVDMMPGDRQFHGLAPCRFVVVGRCRSAEHGPAAALRGPSVPSVAQLTPSARKGPPVRPTPLPNGR